MPGNGVGREPGRIKDREIAEVAESQEGESQTVELALSQEEDKEVAEVAENQEGESQTVELAES